MGNGKTVSLQVAMKKIESLENRVKRMEKRLFSANHRTSDSELDLVGKKIAKEEAEMKAKGRKYLTEAQVKQKFGF